MIYASDLDQTLIYSQPPERAELLGERIMIAELIDGKVRSYMSASTYERLQALMNELIFIPVTTRTIEQYRRIHLISQMLKPKYAVTSNGGNVLVDGQVDVEWRDFVRSRVRETSTPVEDILPVMQDVLHQDWVISSSWCDELFFSHIVERDRMPLKEMNDLSAQLQGRGWRTSIQGRKVYIVPEAVSKGGAVSHLQKVLGGRKIVASGDSLLDQSLLDVADFAIAPGHGELFRQEQMGQSGNYRFTEESGIFAADHITMFVQSTHTEHKKLLAKESS
ncbi:hypothetical protein A8709_08350 [Paenibacillus pectinilyticus]|uniref:Sucrose phosphatase-like domain-containing protein n=1 Tax=Paenibacillus pectinilyticus TaxID=512399 RepID=A0A1C1A7T9_9BACL|nr:HAD family hydrolase [Paenibacillus pectinilyticus]OCT16674.1 hypothetical protein A8709_08350 [Paenibacillus pectinilyticus]